MRLGHCEYSDFGKEVEFYSQCFRKALVVSRRGKLCFLFKWLPWFLKSEICTVRGSRVEAESPAGGTVAGAQEGMKVARTVCLASRTLCSWDEHLLLSNNTIVFLSLYLWRLGRTQKSLYLNPTTLSASCWSSGQLQGHGPEQTACPVSSFSGVPLWSPTATEPKRLC